MSVRLRLAGKACELEEVRNWGNDRALLNLAVEHLEAGNWAGFIFVHPRPLRLGCFFDIAPRLTDPEYWRLLAEIWMDAEAPGFNRAGWLQLFTLPRSAREHLMTPQEQAGLDALPERVQIYRGAPRKFGRGLSWTTSLKIAEWFARRFDRGGGVHTATVRKRRIIAYFAGRQESEVVIDPRRIPIDSPHRDRY